jgi:hypothetical protein
MVLPAPDDASLWCSLGLLQDGGGSAGLAVVVPQQSSEAIASRDRRTLSARPLVGIDQFVADALMNSFPVVLIDVLLDRVFERVFPERDHRVQTYLANRPDETLGERVRVGISVRRADRRDAAGAFREARTAAPAGDSPEFPAVHRLSPRLHRDRANCAGPWRLATPGKVHRRFTVGSPETGASWR